MIRFKDVSRYFFMKETFHETSLLALGQPVETRDLHVSAGCPYSSLLPLWPAAIRVNCNYFLTCGILRGISPRPLCGRHFGTLF